MFDNLNKNLLLFMLIFLCETISFSLETLSFGLVYDAFYMAVVAFGVIHISIYLNKI